MADTRKDQRAPVSLKVRFKSATVDEFIEQYCRDVSRGGIFIKSSQPMPMGTLLKFQLQLKDESSLIKGVGRVVWIRAEDDASAEGPAGMGIKFIKMDSDSRSVVDRIVAAHAGGSGAYDQGEPELGETTPPPSSGSGTAFFPDLPPAVLPPPEDRTAVRHAAQFLASTLSESGTDEAATREAEQKAEEATRRSAQIEAQQLAEAERQKSERAGEGLPSMIIDPSLSVPRPAPDESDDRPTDAAIQRVPEFELPTERKERPKPKAETPAAETTSEDTNITERQQAEAAMLRNALAEQGQPKKSNVLPILVIVTVVLVAAFMALRGGDADMSEETSFEPSVTARMPETTPRPAVEPAPAPEPNPARVTNPAQVADPARVADPAATPEAAPKPAAAVMIPVRITTTPDGADVFVRGRREGTAPLTIELAEGVAVTIQARSPGRSEATEELTPDTAHAALALTLAPLPCVLHVESTPPGASVSVGGKRAKTPVDLTLSAPPKESLTVSLRLAGYESTSTTVLASSFEQREGALRASVAVDLTRRVAAPKPPARSPGLGAKPDEEAATEASDRKPGVSEPDPKPIDAAPKPIDAAPTPKPPAKPTQKPKSSPTAEPIPDNPFG